MKKDLLVTDDLKRRWSEVSEDYFLTEYVEKKRYPALPIRHNYILTLLDDRPGRVLDIGCGPGRMVIDLMKRDNTVYGVDISEEMLRIADENIRKEGVGGEHHLSQGNIESLDFDDNFFDQVVCAGVIEYLKEDDKAVRELNRVLKEGGTLILTVRNKTCPFRILDSLMDSIKAARKNSSAGQKVNRYIPYRKHVPSGLDRLLEEHGFRKTDFRYFHFYPFLAQFEKLCPGLFIKTGMKMERLTNTSLGWLGSGYIVKAVKTSASTR